MVEEYQRKQNSIKRNGRVTALFIYTDTKQILKKITEIKIGWAKPKEKHASQTKRQAE